MGEGFDQSTEGVLDLIYIVTHNGLVETTQSPEDALADYGGMQLTGEIEWFRIIRVAPCTQELEILYAWGEMGKYHLSYAKRHRSSHEGQQWAIQFRTKIGHGEQYFPELHHMWCILLSLRVSDPDAQIVAWRVSQKKTRQRELGAEEYRMSTKNYVVVRVNGMRAFFE